MSESVFEERWSFAGGTIALQVRSDRPDPAIQDKYPRLAWVCAELRLLADEIDATRLWEDGWPGRGQ